MVHHEGDELRRLVRSEQLTPQHRPREGRLDVRAVAVLQWIKHLSAGQQQNVIHGKIGTRIPRLREALSNADVPKKGKNVVANLQKQIISD